MFLLHMVDESKFLPLIRQAGSVEAFAGSPATGREQLTIIIGEQGSRNYFSIITIQHNTNLSNNNLRNFLIYN